MLKKPLLSEKSGAKSWPDVRDTVVTDRMLFYNGCNITAEQIINNREGLSSRTYYFAAD